VFNIPNTYDPLASWNPQPVVCHWCKKPRHAETILIRWENGTLQNYYFTRNGIPIPSDSFCPGHVSEECPVCKWMVVLEYHTPEECKRLREVMSGSR